MDALNPATAVVHQPAPADFTFPQEPPVGRGGGPIRGIVLVGGRGTRLSPLTDKTPKPLLEVGGVPMIEHAIARLARAGVRDVTLALAFRPDDFITAYPDGLVHGVTLHYAIEDEPLDTGGAIANAMRHRGIDDTFIVCNGDIIDGVEISPLLAVHLTGDALATIELHAVEDPSRYGVVACDPYGRVQCFVEKPPAGQEPSNTINAGTYVLEPAALAQIENGQRVSIERETFPTLAAAGQLYAHTFDGYWLDAGKVDSYRQANLDMAAAHGGVHHGAVVDPRSRVVDSILGDRVQVAAGAVVIDSILGAGCVIGPGAHIVDSILGPGVVVAALQEISGAVIA